MTSGEAKSIRACSIISDTGDARWEQIMKNFTQDNKLDTKKSEFLEIQMPRVLRAMKKFPTGSSYHGSWNLLGISGYGVYVFPHGVEYRGYFEDGEFHGEGELVYQDGTLIKGIFRKGELIEKTLVFFDGLLHDERNWEYCKMPDRRYTEEIDNGIQPAGKTYITSTKPSREIPAGHYDTGDGFYNPKTRLVCKYEDPTCDFRIPSDKEEKWILKNCRTAHQEHKPCPQFYEKWVDADLEFDNNPPPLAKTMKYFTERESDVSYEELRRHQASVSRKSYFGFGDSEEIISCPQFNSTISFKKNKIKKTTFKKTDFKN